MSRFLGLTLAPILFGLVACSEPRIENGELADVLANYEAMSAVYRDNPPKQRAFQMALFRAVSPVEFAPPSDDFDLKKALPVATSRERMPEPGSDTYAAVIHANADSVAGMSGRTIVEKYVSQDSAVLRRQEEWARGWQTRNRIKSRNDGNEASRRASLLARFTAQQASYVWESGKPFLKFTMRNPLDVPLDRIEIDLDLFDPAGQRRLASGKIQGVLRTPLQPEAMTQVRIDLSQYKQLASPQLRNFGNSLHPQVAYRNAWTKDKSLIFAEALSNEEFDARNLIVLNLLQSINESKKNLSGYRIMFSE